MKKMIVLFVFMLGSIMALAFVPGDLPASREGSIWIGVFGLAILFFGLTISYLRSLFIKYKKRKLFRSLTKGGTMKIH
jgi:hypothetical protein